MNTSIPIPAIVVLSDIISCYTHNELNILFLENGAPGEIPEGSKVVKCKTWLKRCNSDPEFDASKILGKILEKYMEVDIELVFTSMESVVSFFAALILGSL